MHETEINRERAFCQRNASLPDCVSCFLQGYEGVQSDGKGIAPRNPAASGTPGQDDVLRVEAALCLAVRLAGAPGRY